MRVSAYSYAMVLCLVCLLAPLPAESSTTHSTAMPEALIGTWRLLTIEYSGPVGPCRPRIVPGAIQGRLSQIGRRRHSDASNDADRKLTFSRLAYTKPCRLQA
jgi:hypothetical protein